MPQENFFFTENPTENDEPITNRLPIRNTLNYVNTRFSISETDQHDILDSLFSIIQPTSKSISLQKRLNGESKWIRNEKRYQKASHHNYRSVMAL